MALVYPETCLGCSDTLLSSEKYICTSCKFNIPVTNDHLNESNELLKKFAFEPKIRSASAFLYFNKGGVAQKFLHQLKYNGNKEIGRYLGAVYGKILKDYLVADVIVPVPLHKSKSRKRGYNQSAFFAAGLSGELNMEVREDLVMRDKKMATQTRMSQVGRWENVMNIFSKVHEDLAGRSVLVVDDVITTGATIGMLCQQLVEANVASIHLACIARSR